MKIAVIGTGYVGLVSGACFAEFGFNVTCVDIDADKISALKAGNIPIYEPGLEDIVKSNISAERLHFTTNLQQAASTCDILFIAVGTPPHPETGEADLQYVYQAAEDIAKATRTYALIVTKSTVPIGTGKEIERVVTSANPDAKFDIASNPEFLREGAAIADFMRPDRVVVGVESEQAEKWLRQLYRPLTRHHIPLVVTGRETAEMIKYSSNAFLATKVAFINEMADICEEVGANIEEVAYGMGLDDRIGERFLRAGPGFGGSCFPKDTQALAHIARQQGKRSYLVESVIESNHARKIGMAHKIINAMGGNVSGKTIAMLGLTFKPSTDDMRDAPSLDIIPALIAEGATLRVFDPEGMAEAKPLLDSPHITWCDDAYSCMEGADCLSIVTEWNEFKRLDLDRARSLLNQALIVDMRNIYKRDEMLEASFTYISIGRETITPNTQATEAA